MLFLLLSGCTNSDLEYWVPDSEIKGSYILLQDGALRLGAEFIDENQAFDTIYQSETDNPRIVTYKQKLGMFDFTTQDTRIIAITIPDSGVMLSSKYYVGMTEDQILGIVGTCIQRKIKDTHLYLDVTTGVCLEVRYNSAGKSELMRLSCIRLKGEYQ